MSSDAIDFSTFGGTGRNSSGGTKTSSFQKVHSATRKGDGDDLYRRSHAVQQPQFEWQRHLRESFRPVGLDLAVFDLLRPRNDLRQPLALDCGRDTVVGQLLH